MTTTPTLPPPLSAPPTIATLQGLLDGLQQPLHRGVPSPPAPERVVARTAEPATRPTPLDRGSVLDLTRLEQLAASRRVVAPTLLVASAPPDDVAAPSRPTGSASRGVTPSAPPVLSWSAGRAHRHARRAAALAAVATAAGTVAALVAAGELALP